jgi:H+-translocating NAD(P) transhydrogenase subunit beta
MNLGWLETVVHLGFILAATLFVIGLHQMNSPATARRGNQLSAVGMTIAVGGTLIMLATTLRPPPIGWAIIGTGLAVGGGLGFWTARTVKMTAIPQLVSLFNAVGGGAAALIAIDDYIRLAGLGSRVPLETTVFTVLDVIIGAVTFSGSLIASGKLQGLVTSRPVVFPLARLINLALVGVALGGAAYLFAGNASIAVLFVIIAVALVFGVTLVMPIGGADMPVVISLLNSFTGTAVAMAGFVITNPVLIIAGALVGASGAILTKLMADAMNRSILNIIVGGFGTGDTAGAGGAAGRGGAVNIREVNADDVAIMMAYARQVIIVPGYGLAVAQAQHACRELADLLEAKGVAIKYAIHPVAGRMPGHMNVLLAEANVPYPQLYEMEDINPEFDRCDVALVVGANDVTNPAARTDTTSPIYGMPILNVDHAKQIVVIKRSMRPGYAGIDNLLYTDPKCGMLFGDAKAALEQLIAAVKAL